MTTKDTDNGTEEELDLSSGMVPHHNLGPWTGIDHDTGLPIVKRASAGTSNQVAKEEVGSESEVTPKTDKPEEDDGATGQPAASAKPGAPALQKGQKVKHADGTTGTVAYVDKQLKIARVNKDGGGSMTAPLSKLSSQGDEEPNSSTQSVPKGKILVKEHFRGKPDMAELPVWQVGR